MATLPAVDNVTMTPSSATFGDCMTSGSGEISPNTTWPDNATTNSNTNSTSPCVPLPILPSGSGLNVPFITQCIIGVCILLANLSILIVLRRCRPAGRTLHYLLQNLALADLGMAVATFWRVGLVARYGLTVEDVPLRCVPVVALYLVSAGVSISSLLLIAVDQWYSTAQNASLEVRQRWRRCCRLAVPCSWVLWLGLGLLSIPVTKAQGTYLRTNASCLMTGPFIQNFYWQLVGLPLIALCIVTVAFQWLSLQAARANTQNLMEALRQRHEGFVLGRPKKQLKRTSTLISFFTSKMSSGKASSSVFSSYKVNESEGGGSIQFNGEKVCYHRNSSCQICTCKGCGYGPSGSSKCTDCKVSRKISVQSSSKMRKESTLSNRKMSTNENSNGISGTRNRTSFSKAGHKLSVKKISAPEMNHPAAHGDEIGKFTSKITTGLGSSYSMSQSGSINRISPLDSDTLPIKGDYYEMKLANMRLQLTRTIGIVMGVFVVTWFVYLPLALMLSACGAPCHNVHSKVAFVGTIPILNSLMNAIIYTFRIKQYRAALRVLFCGEQARRNSAMVPSVNVTTIREIALPPIN